MKRAFPGRRALATVLVALALALTLITPALAAADDYPAPPASLVADFANVLSADERAQLEQILNGIEAKTTCQVAFVTVTSTNNIPVEEYRVELFERWGIGQKGKDNGLLVLVVTGAGPGQRDIQIEVGYGLEPIVTDSLAGRYLDDYAIPALRENKYGEGLISLANAFATLLTSKYDPANPPTSGGQPGSQLPARTFGVSTALLLFALPVLFIVGMIVAAATLLTPKCPHCRSRLYTHDRVIQPATMLAHGHGLRVRTCPKCGFRDEQTYQIPRLVRINTWGGPRGGGGFGGFGGRGGGGFGGFGGGRSGGGGAGRKF